MAGAVDTTLAASPNASEASRRLAETFKPFSAQIDYDNDQFRTSIFPLYQRMLQVFSQNYWLASGSTKRQFEALASYVDLWQRHLAQSLPPSIITQLQTSEAKLEPFYNDIASELSRLSDLVGKGRAA